MAQEGHKRKRLDRRWYKVYSTLNGAQNRDRELYSTLQEQKNDQLKRLMVKDLMRTIPGTAEKALVEVV